MQTTSGSQTADKAQTPAPISTKYERINKYSLSLTNGGTDPWWQLDFGREGIPIKYVLLTPRESTDATSCNPGMEVLVGDDPTPGANPSCIGLFDNVRGKEVSCGLAGRYVTVRRPGKDRICLNGVAVFLDCGSELIWDSLTQPNAPISVGETLQIPLSLATTLETALEANVCGELQLTATNLPSFCIQTGALIECTP